MAAIRSRNTRPEMSVRRAVHAAGFRYRINQKSLPGKPDLVFSRFKIAAFVHGCYWHGHTCKEAKRPLSNLAYWTPKIDGNVARDERVKAELENSGWHVVIVRECTAREDTRSLISLLQTKRT
jgi:DNA mismatch endonuclease (patch repair protein)